MSLIVFDLDGTLVDSRLDLAESTNEMLGTFGAPALSVDRVAMMVGEGARKLVVQALAAAGLGDDAAGVNVDDALGRFREIYDRRLLVHTRPYDGIAEAVNRLSRIGPLAVLTNKPDAPSRRLLDAFELSGYFQQVIGGDSEFARKPDPEGLRALMKQFGSGPADTWLIGDSMIDVQTARNAGTRMCVALYGFGQLRGELVLNGSEQTASTPSEITEIVTNNKQ